MLSHLKEWDHQIENEPNVNHLDVGGLGQVLRDGYEHGCQHQHHSQVDGDNGLVHDALVHYMQSRSACLKEEGLEVVGHVGDDDEKQGGDVDGENGAQQSSGRRDL